MRVTVFEQWNKTLNISKNLDDGHYFGSREENITNLFGSWILTC